MNKREEKRLRDLFDFRVYIPATNEMEQLTGLVITKDKVTVRVKEHLVLDITKVPDSFPDWRILQYTGFKDCKNKKIYEGDRLAFSYSNDEYIYKYSTDDLSDFHNEGVVVGNVYQKENKA